jgi:hypothetical protein
MAEEIASAKLTEHTTYDLTTLLPFPFDDKKLIHIPRTGIAPHYIQATGAYYAHEQTFRFDRREAYTSTAEAQAHIIQEHLYIVVADISYTRANMQSPFCTLYLCLRSSNFPKGTFRRYSHHGCTVM